MADLLIAIQKLATQLIPNSKGDKRAAYVLRLAEYANRYAGTVPTSKAVAEALPVDWTGTYEEALAKFLDAEDEALKASGQVYGRNGEPRGSMTRQAHIELAQSIGVLEELGGEDFFGPLSPGTSQ